MHGRKNTAVTPRRGIPRAGSMPARQRRREMADLIAAGLARAIALRTEPPVEHVPDSEDFAADGLELSETPTLSVHTGGTPDRNEIKVGEQT